MSLRDVIKTFKRHPDFSKILFFNLSLTLLEEWAGVRLPLVVVDGKDPVGVGRLPQKCPEFSLTFLLRFQWLWSSVTGLPSFLIVSRTELVMTEMFMECQIPKYMNLYFMICSPTLICRFRENTVKSFEFDWEFLSTYTSKRTFTTVLLQTTSGITLLCTRLSSPSVTQGP